MSHDSSRALLRYIYHNLYRFRLRNSALAMSASACQRAIGKCTARTSIHSLTHSLVRCRRPRSSGLSVLSPSPATQETRTANKAAACTLMDAQLQSLDARIRLYTRGSDCRRKDPTLDPKVRLQTQGSDPRPKGPTLDPKVRP